MPCFTPAFVPSKITKTGSHIKVPATTSTGRTTGLEKRSAEQEMVGSSVVPSHLLKERNRPNNLKKKRAERVAQLNLHEKTRSPGLARTYQNFAHLRQFIQMVRGYQEHDLHHALQLLEVVCLLSYEMFINRKSYFVFYFFHCLNCLFNLFL